MADAGLFIGWGQVVRGREDRALEVFNETIQTYGQMQSDGRIEDFEVALLQPHGGELAGYAMLRGSEAQMDALGRDDDFQRLMQRADLIVDGLGIVPALIGEGLGRAIAMYQEEIAVVA
ncbi:MAG TPA: hypothetical protein VFY47_15290 [Thermoleophilaceae bacterium]|jgi:hypothetical protein|nr:hypothetical protein [Thermoleophilaceae bacterium]